MLARRGQWQPGQSGNPKARPSIEGEVETLARTHTVEAGRILAAYIGALIGGNTVIQEHCR